MQLTWFSATETYRKEIDCKILSRWFRVTFTYCQAYDETCFVSEVDCTTCPTAWTLEPKIYKKNMRIAIDNNKIWWNSVTALFFSWSCFRWSRNIWTEKIGRKMQTDKKKVKNTEIMFYYERWYGLVPKLTVLNRLASREMPLGYQVRSVKHCVCRSEGPNHLRMQVMFTVLKLFRVQIG